MHFWLYAIKIETLHFTCMANVVPICFLFISYLSRSSCLYLFVGLYFLQMIMVGATSKLVNRWVVHAYRSLMSRLVGMIQYVILIPTYIKIICVHQLPLHKCAVYPVTQRVPTRVVSVLLMPTPASLSVTSSAGSTVTLVMTQWVDVVFPEKRKLLRCLWRVMHLDMHLSLIPF